MATPAIMWVFIATHIIGLVVLGWLLSRMDIKSDEELKPEIQSEGVS